MRFILKSDAMVDDNGTKRVISLHRIPWLSIPLHATRRPEIIHH